MTNEEYKRYAAREGRTENAATPDGASGIWT